MDINITVLIQALQFGIAYYFLYHFLFTPACKVLDEDAEIEKKLHESLNLEHGIKNDLQCKYKEKSLALKHALIKEIPSVSIEAGSKKNEKTSTLYSVENVEVLEKKLEDVEQFLINNLSQVVKHDR